MHAIKNDTETMMMPSMRKEIWNLPKVNRAVCNTVGTCVAITKPNATPKKEDTLRRPNIRPRWCAGNESDKKDCAMGNIPPLANPTPARQPIAVSYEGDKLVPMQKHPQIKHSTTTMRFGLPCER